MRNRIHKLLTGIWIAGFLMFGFKLFNLELAYEEGKQEYKELNQVIIEHQTNEKKTICEMEKLPENYLKKMNPDYIFWLSIPGISINYPVVRNPQPGYYLNHTFKQSVNACGSLFVQEQIKDLDNENTVIFGHNMKNGTMFSELKKYKNQSFYKNHTIIRIYYHEKWYEAIIFSCQLQEEQNLTCYQTEFYNAEEKEEFINKMKKASLYYIPVDPSVKNPIVTLSTCYGHAQRLIVQAFMV